MIYASRTIVITIPAMTILFLHSQSTTQRILIEFDDALQGALIDLF